MVRHLQHLVNEMVPGVGHSLQKMGLLFIDSFHSLPRDAKKDPSSLEIPKFELAFRCSCSASGLVLLFARR